MTKNYNNTITRNSVVCTMVISLIAGVSLKSILSEKTNSKIRKAKRKLIPGCFVKIAPEKNKLEEKEHFAKLLKNGTVEIYTKNPYREYVFKEVLNLKKFVEKYKCVDDVENLN